MGKSLLFLLLCLGTLPGGAQEDVPYGIPVLAYHRFDPRLAGPTTVLTGNFLKQMDWLVEHGYRVVPLQEVVDCASNKKDMSSLHRVAITIDDGHRSVYTVLYPILRARSIPVTLFLYPSAISRASYALTWEQVEEMQHSGLVTIASHTLWHPDFRREKKRLNAQAYQALVHDQLTRSRSILEKRTGTRIQLLAWPYGIFDDDLERAAQQAGYTAAFAYDGRIATPNDPIFAMHRIPVRNQPGIAGFPQLTQSSRRNAAGTP